MKKGSMLINCARGGIVDEDALYDALKSGHLAGAALDVFSQEPPGRIKLMELPNFICTPHLGASTGEAQDNVARDVAHQITEYLLHGTVKNAVNVPSISSELMGILRPFVTVVERMGSLQTQLAESAVVEARIEYSGKVAEYDLKPLTTAMLKGLLTPIMKDDVNFVNAVFIAEERGIKVVESRTKTSKDFASLIKLTVKTLERETVVSGTVVGSTMPRILRINNFYLEAIPEGHILLIESEDSPGVIGTIAMKIGAQGVNISRMQVGEEKGKKQNIILMTTNTGVPDKLVDELKGLDFVFSVKKVAL
jgi:D-3-phosphoglycerate dehydrogenase / 2-oxoglutarate reductase